MNLRSFLSELRRRNVYKVAVAYVVAGWLDLALARNDEAMRWLDSSYANHQLDLN